MGGKKALYSGPLIDKTALRIVFGWTMEARLAKEAVSQDASHTRRHGIQAITGMMSQTHR